MVRQRQFFARRREQNNRQRAAGIPFRRGRRISTDVLHFANSSARESLVNFRHRRRAQQQEALNERAQTATVSLHQARDIRVFEEGDETLRYRPQELSQGFLNSDIHRDERRENEIAHSERNHRVRERNENNRIRVGDGEIRERPRHHERRSSDSRLHRVAPSIQHQRPKRGSGNHSNFDRWLREGHDVVARRRERRPPPSWRSSRERSSSFRNEMNSGVHHSKRKTLDEERSPRVMGQERPLRIGNEPAEIVQEQIRSPAKLRDVAEHAHPIQEPHGSPSRKRIRRPPLPPVLVLDNDGSIEQLQPLRAFPGNRRIVDALDEKKFPLVEIGSESSSPPPPRGETFRSLLEKEQLTLASFRAELIEFEGRVFAVPDTGTGRFGKDPGGMKVVAEETNRREGTIMGKTNEEHGIRSLSENICGGEEIEVKRSDSISHDLAIRHAFEVSVSTTTNPFKL